MKLVEIDNVKIAALKRVKRQQQELEASEGIALDRLTTIRANLKEVRAYTAQLDSTVEWYHDLNKCPDVTSVFIRADKPSSLYFTIRPITVVVHKNTDVTVDELARAQQPTPLIELAFPIARGSLYIWNHKQFVDNDGRTGGTLARVLNRRTNHWENPVKKRTKLSRYPHPTIDGQARPCWGNITDKTGRIRDLGHRISSLLRDRNINGLVKALYSYLEQDPNFIHRDKKNSRKTPFRVAAAKTKKWEREIIGETNQREEGEAIETPQEAHAAKTDTLDEIIREAVAYKPTEEEARRRGRATLETFETYEERIKNWTFQIDPATTTTTVTDTRDTANTMGTDALPREEGEG